ncbi:hypothetical protein ACFQ0X_39190 [Streptomyces rectiviolaceus]|uniref:Secreted protein n=1 Tax=Streptomyces rectiviolaceus TaxID=332591 RepID=A0ABP6MF92_9ACTN
MRMRRSLGLLAVTAAITLAGSAGTAYAESTPLEPGHVQAMAMEGEDTLQVRDNAEERLVVGDVVVESRAIRGTCGGHACGGGWLS